VLLLEPAFTAREGSAELAVFDRVSADATVDDRLGSDSRGGGTGFGVERLGGGGSLGSHR
jgi:hypothetical protein